MIYSRDAIHLGGTVSNAAKAVENMVDVNVDKVNRESYFSTNPCNFMQFFNIISMN